MINPKLVARVGGVGQEWGPWLAVLIRTTWFTGAFPKEEDSILDRTESGLVLAQGTAL